MPDNGPRTAGESRSKLEVRVSRVARPLFPIDGQDQTFFTSLDHWAGAWYSEANLSAFPKKKTLLVH